MTESTHDASAMATVGIDAPDLERYGRIRLEDGQVIIYDRDGPDAWLQSDAPVDLEATR